jgi:hypothetical protein
MEVLMTTIKRTIIGVALAASAMALGACSSDGYSRTSLGVGISSGGYDRYDGYGNRRDWDGDGIPNRYDMDRDGDGVSNRFDWAPNNPYRR